MKISMVGPVPRINLSLSLSIRLYPCLSLSLSFNFLISSFYFHFLHVLYYYPVITSYLFFFPICQSINESMNHQSIGQ